MLNFKSISEVKVGDREHLLFFHLAPTDLIFLAPM